MNLLLAEKAFVMYLRRVLAGTPNASIEGFINQPANLVPIVEQTSSDSMVELNKSLLVVSSIESEFWGFGRVRINQTFQQREVFRTRFGFALMSPALSVSLTDHSTYWNTISSALSVSSRNNITNTFEETGYNVGIWGYIPRTQTASTEERKWTSSMETEAYIYPTV
jgi:hypothetical protein